jgi:hypothetical protein
MRKYAATFFLPSLGLQQRTLLADPHGGISETKTPGEGFDHFASVYLHDALLVGCLS